MTLAELASYLTTKLNQTAPSDVAAAKMFLKRRYEMIWADQLWKDSLFEYTQVLGLAADYVVTDSWLPTKQTLLLPPIFTHVVAARTADRAMRVESSEIWYRMDFDTFENTGYAAQYRLLSPAVWEFETAQAIYALSVPADAAAVVTVDTVQGTTRARTNVSLSGFDSVGSIERIDSVSKKGTQGGVLLGVYSVDAILIVNSSAGAVQFSVDGAAAQMIAAGGQNYNVPGAQITANGANATAIPGAETFIGTVTWDGTAFSFDTTQEDVVTMVSTDTNAAKRQRIQLLGSIPNPTTIRVLGKISPPTFTDDGDEPGLTGIENTLLAFAMADMLQVQRQYGKAQAVTQEAVALLEQLKRVQTVQQAFRKRFIPDDGFGTVWDGYYGLTGPFEFGKSIGSSPAAEATMQRTTGRVALGSGVSGGRLDVYSPFAPTSVNLWVSVPTDGSIINAFDIVGSLSASGVSYYLDGATPALGYYLNYEFIP